jgi:RNA polymerase sigma-70 factor (ECF subfamily)
MEAYDQRRVTPTASNRARTDKVLQRFLALLAEGDVRGIEQMLTDDVKAITDGGGEFTASLIPIVGAAAVARFFARLAASRDGRVAIAIRSVNLFPTAVLEFEAPKGRRPRCLALSVDVDANGLIAAVRVIASSKKLAHLMGNSGTLMELHAVAAPAG